MKRNYSSSFRNLAAILFFALLGYQVSAQTSFTGSWSLNESKSNMGEGRGRRAASAMVVTQDVKLLTVESTRPGPEGGEMKQTAKYNLDGSVSENPGFGDNMSKSTATWSADKTVLTIATAMTFERNGETMTRNSSQIWKLTEGGKILMVENKRTNQEGTEVTTTAAYDKK